jgi:hypothetical protein
MPKRLSETTVRQTIGMMRSIASNVPISPFHLQAAKEMEQLLEEALVYRQINDALKLAIDPKKYDVRNQVLEQVAQEFDRMKNGGNTTASFAVHIRNMKT